MARTVYALFAGIDAYPAPVRPLNGCVNDVTRMRDLLGARVTGASDRFEPRLLVNEQVTRQGLIDAVVHDLMSKMVGPRRVGIHAGTTTYRVQAGKHLNGGGVIVFRHRSEIAQAGAEHVLSDTRLAKS